MNTYHKFIACIFLFSSLYSCKKSFKIEEFHIDPINSKVLVFDTTDYAQHRNPRFLYNHFLKTSGEIRNLSGQTLETIELIPTIEISYKNELDQIIDLPQKSITKNTQHAKKIGWSSIYDLEESKSFKKKILLHEAEDVIFKLKVRGNNSIGFKTEMEDPFLYEHDITDQWNSYHKFYNDSTYNNVTRLFNNYAIQFARWIKDFNSWNEPTLTEILQFYSTDKYISEYDISSWDNTARNFHDSQKLLFTNFYKDFKKTSNNNIVEKNWELFMIHFDKMTESRIRINKELERLVSYKKNIESQFQIPQRKKINFKTLKREENQNYSREYDNYKKNLAKALESYPTMLNESGKLVKAEIDSLRHNSKIALQYYTKCHNEIKTLIGIDHTVENFEVF